jgi:hypothetical protein
MSWIILIQSVIDVIVAAIVWLTFTRINDNSDAIIFIMEILEKGMRREK